MTEPTKRQRDVLRAIHYSAMALGTSPTYRDLCEALGVKSKNAVNDHLVKLEEKGLIVKRPGRCRGLALTVAGLDAIDRRSVIDRLDKLEERIDQLESRR